MKSLFWRNFIVYSCLILIIFLLFGGSFIMLVDRYAANENQRMLTQTATRVSDNTSLLLQNYSRFIEQLYKTTLSQTAADNGVHIIVCNSDGRIAYFFDDAGRQASVMSLPDTSAVNTVATTGSYSELGDLGGIFSRAMYVTGVPVKNAGSDFAGAVFTALPAGETVKLLRDISRVFIFGIGLALIMALTVSYFITDRLVSPLRDLANAAKSFGRGDFSVRVPIEPTRQDEVAELALSFNNMAAGLENNEEQRRGFVANVSHDLKTPMTTIAGFVDGMLDGTIPPEKERECLEIISGEVKRLSRLATRMLEMSKIESGGVVLNKTRFDVCEMASRVILSFEQTLSRRNVNVDVDMPDSLQVTADHDMLFQAIYNLVDNAVKFVGENGVLTMRISDIKGEAMEFSVANTGPEIPEEDLPHVFDRFYKVDRSRGLNKQGSGLGLYIVKTAIGLHGGEVGVTSCGGVTTFTFIIPTV